MINTDAGVCFEINLLDLVWVLTCGLTVERGLYHCATQPTGYGTLSCLKMTPTKPAVNTTITSMVVNKSGLAVECIMQPTDIIIILSFRSRSKQNQNPAII